MDRILGVLAMLVLLAGCDFEIEHTPAVPLAPAGMHVNPVIPGFAPDPSIVRVGEDFYLVNSSFEYMPGLPIHHSRDLVNWELIGHALVDPGPIRLGDVESSGGIHAATIRHHDGLFYVVTTNIYRGEATSFIVTAEDPAGPWSEPVIIEDAEGIDPSLLFAEDGRVWYTANRVPPDPEFSGQAEIWTQEIDPEPLQLVGERHALWRGCCQGVWAEGPHIYEREGMYYLLISEGGTSFEHAMAVAVSDSPTGPFRNNPRNPVLTHRQLTYDYPISGVGHADMVELEDGRWYAVALGWRLIEGRHGLLGRETHLVPVIWEEEPHDWLENPDTWPVFAPETGRIELLQAAPYPERRQDLFRGFSTRFEGPLAPQWNMRRHPERPFHRLEGGALVLTAQAETIGDRAAYSFLGIRQQEFRYRAETEVSVADLRNGSQAGLAVLMNDRAAYWLSFGQDGWLEVVDKRGALYGTSGGLQTGHDRLHLRADVDGLELRFSWSAYGESWTEIGGVQDLRALSPAEIGGFNYTGVYVGPYASGPAGGEARFEHFRMGPADTD
jgi:alpha-N-arabinofuranosidase